MTPDDERNAAVPISSSRSRIRREVYWFLLAFGFPFLFLHAIDLLPQRGGAPWWKRLLLIEDACPYGICILIPTVTYVVSRLVGWIVAKWGGATREARRRT